MKMKIALDEGSTMPTRAHEHDAGLDLYANETAYKSTRERTLRSLVDL